MPIKVLVVDDAVVIRKILVDIVDGDPDLEVVGTASNGKIGLQKIEQLKPDLVTLDIEMPEMDGLEALKILRQTNKDLPVIMFSTLTSRGASVTLDALAAGASDYITKPANVGSTGAAIRQVTEELVPRIKALTASSARRAPAGAGSAAAVPRRAAAPGGAAPQRSTPANTGRVDAVVVGSSTGGPVALEAMLSAIKSPLPVPMFIVQHMPPVFTTMLAQRLASKTATKVVEAEAGMVPEPGHAYLAPGGQHMIVVRKGPSKVIELTDGDPVNFCKPAVDVLFNSTSDSYGAAQLAVILTGMGQDGMVGCQTLVEKHKCDVFAQDEQSSVVWGMPGAVVGAGLASKILPLDQVGQAIVTRVGARATAGVR